MAQDGMTQLRDFATRDAAAWCSQDAADDLLEKKGKVIYK